MTKYDRCGHRLRSGRVCGLRARYMIRHLATGAYSYMCKRHGDKLPESEYGWTGI